MLKLIKEKEALSFRYNSPTFTILNEEKVLIEDLSENVHECISLAIHE